MQVQWDGAVNGWRVNDGLFRMGRHEAVTTQGWRQAHTDGVRRVVDLRSPREHGRRPGDPEAVIEGIEVVSRPTEDADSPEFAQRFSPYLESPADYADYLDLFADRVVAALLAVAKAPGGVVVHCSAGRDRTGLVVTLGQLYAGVPTGRIEAGWVKAAEGINDFHRDHFHPREGYMTGDAWRVYLTPRVEGLRAFMRSVDPDALFARHGVSAAQRESIRRRFVQP